MLAMVLVSTFFLAVSYFGLWSVIKETRDEGTGGTAKTSVSGDSPEPEPRTLEGALVAGLFRHEITVAQYRRAVERLAAREDDRHPLRVPPEAGSDAGKP